MKKISVLKTIKKKQQQYAKRVMTVPASLLAFLMLSSLAGAAVSQTLPGKPYSMFGDPMCSEWPQMNADAKFAWTSGFLSILSMGHESSRRTGQQKYKDLKGIGEVVEVIDKHCSENPAAQASEAAAPFLNQ